MKKIAMCLSVCALMLLGLGCGGDTLSEEEVQEAEEAMEEELDQLEEDLPARL